MINQTDLIGLRALALAISGQSLTVRRHLQEVLTKNPLEVIAHCKETCPQIPWSKLLEQGASKLSGWQQSGMLATCFFESGYPVQLKTIEDPPLILFSRGKQLVELNSRCCLAIVGSRRADAEGLELTQSLASELSREGIVIVSGLALGIDAAAHRGALNSNYDLPTVAVLGSGLNVIYPPNHAILVNEILNNGGIVASQFEPDTPPYPSNFLNRNRVVSGLSTAVLVVEATLKSGSLVTARNALEQGKDVLVVPGDIYNPRFEGSNRLIQQGAILVTGVRDIVDALGVVVSTKTEKLAATNQKSSMPATILEKQIVETLEQRKEMRIDELVRHLGTLSFEKELLILELQGLIQRLPGNVLRLSRR